MTGIEMDPDVQAIAVFMQRKIAASRLVAVADGIAAIAPLLWGSYPAEPLSVLRIVQEPITAAAPHIRAASSE